MALSIIMTKQGGPNGWPHGAREVWDKRNTSRNALDEAIKYSRGLISIALFLGTCLAHISNKKKKMRV